MGGRRTLVGWEGLKQECWQCVSQADPVVPGLPRTGVIVGPGDCFQNLPSLSFRTQFEFEDFKAFTQKLWKKRRAHLDSSAGSAEPGGHEHQAGLPGGVLMGVRHTQHLSTLTLAHTRMMFTSEKARGHPRVRNGCLGLCSVLRLDLEGSHHAQLPEDSGAATCGRPPH